MSLLERLKRNSPILSFFAKPIRNLGFRVSDYFLYMYPDYRCEAYPVNYLVIFIYFKLAYLLVESAPVITLVILVSFKWPSDLSDKGGLGSVINIQPRHDIE